MVSARDLEVWNVKKSQMSIESARDWKVRNETGSSFLCHHQPKLRPSRSYSFCQWHPLETGSCKMWKRELRLLPIASARDREGWNVKESQMSIESARNWKVRNEAESRRKLLCSSSMKQRHWCCLWGSTPFWTKTMKESKLHTVECLLG